MSTALLALGLSAALAQEGPPLAIPNDQVQAPPPPTLRGMTAEQARAARTYRADRLELRPETELQGGGSTMIYQGHGGPWRHGYAGFSYVLRDPVYAVPTWGIYRGPERLTVPEYLGAVGRVGQKADLEAKIEQLERRSGRWYTLGGLGIAATIGSVVAQIVTDDPAINYYGYYTTLGGAGAMVLGFVAGSFPSAKADRLENDPAEWLEARQLQSEIDDYNAALGARLGLSPEQQLMLDSSPALRWTPRVQPVRGGGVSVGVGASF